MHMLPNKRAIRATFKVSKVSGSNGASHLLCAFATGKGCVVDQQPPLLIAHGKQDLVCVLVDVLIRSLCSINLGL